MSEFHFGWGVLVLLTLAFVDGVVRLRAATSQRDVPPKPASRTSHDVALSRSL